jgi:primosomal protein N' (replication factor Y)
VPIGSVVAVRLAGRAIRGWVLGSVETPPDATIRSIDRLVTLGPDRRLVELARFASWRYAGPLRPFLKSASPDRIVRVLPGRARPASAAALSSLTTDAILDSVGRIVRAPLPPSGAHLVRTGPAEPRLGIVAATAAALAGRDLLVLVPEHRDAEIVLARLGRAGIGAVQAAEQWPQAAAGGSIVVGTRRAVFATVGDLGGIVVLDAHAESYVEERAPTSNATVLAAERARREGVPCLLISPTPLLEQCEAHGLINLQGSGRWPTVEVIDQTSADPRAGAYDPRLAAAIRDALDADPRRHVVCVLNRTGRVRLLGCAGCGNLQRCEQCGHALAEPAGREPGRSRALVCPACAAARPFVCEHCGSTKLRQLRRGVARAVEELSALVREPAVEISSTSAAVPEGARLLVGTEAVLHRVRSASLVAFIDFDNELLAARLRAAEQAYVLLGRAARLLGGATTERHRRIVVQTRLPGDAVLRAAQRGDPTVLLESEQERRRDLRLPPYSAMALASGDGIERFFGAIAQSSSVQAARRPDGSVLLRAPDHRSLLDAIAAAEVDGGRVRVAVDPHEI